MNLNYDVIIAGCGISGLYAALNLPSNLRVLLITKREQGLCNSALAQGGIAAVYNSPGDDILLHENDTLVAGGFTNNREATYLLVSEAARDIEKIIELGVDFDRSGTGRLDRTLEGGHSRNRIFHHKDQTGLEIVSKIHAAVTDCKNVHILENTLMCDIKKTSSGFSALLLEDGSGKYKVYNSRYFIMATGGIGRVYEQTTNSAIATGDGISLAYDMGAEIRSLSRVQFHPTAFRSDSMRQCLLISESVRGEGAYLLNAKGERFMRDYDDRLELAPRDIVSKSIILESRRQGSDSFYIDISHKDTDFIINRFPGIYRSLLEHGFNLTKDRIPIYPCQHYLMGGIDVDENGRTSISGLYAVGECSHTGVHGNNRLASNSLLEALVFSRRAAEDIARRAKGEAKLLKPHIFDLSQNTQTIPHGIRTEIRAIMQKSYFVIPDRKAISDGFGRVMELRRMLIDGKYRIDYDYTEAKALATVAYLILRELSET